MEPDDALAEFSIVEVEGDADSADALTQGRVIRDALEAGERLIVKLDTDETDEQVRTGLAKAAAGQSDALNILAGVDP